MRLTEKQQEYWKKNLTVTAWLLLLWFGVTFVGSYFARELNSMVILGFPLGFYLGAQGALVVYVAVIFFYVRYMNHLDREYGVNEGEEE